MNIKIAPKVIPGSLNPLNKNAIEWGWQGKLAYGCHNSVIVVDTETCQHIQALDGHRSYVVKVKWARENYYHDHSDPYTLRLASADHVGRIIVWNVTKGEVKVDFSDGNKPIQELEWLPLQDSANDLLVALHPPYSIILWRADTGQKLWKKSYTEPLISFSFDPFNMRKMAFLGQDCIVFVDDFSIHKSPSSNGKKFYISSPSQGSSTSGASGSSEKKKEKNTLQKRFSQILLGETRQKTPPEEESVALNECLQLAYLKSCRHHFMLLYAREILILDLEINQTVGILCLDRTASPYIQVIPCRQRDALLCLHENGSVTMRLRRKDQSILSPTETVGTFGSSDDVQYSTVDVFYELRCQSDPLRLTKHNKMYGFTYSPCNENGAAILMSNGKLLFWSLKAIETMNDLSTQTPLFTPGSNFSRIQIPGQCKLNLHSNVSHPKLALTDMIGAPKLGQSSVTRKGHPIALKFVLTGMLEGVPHEPVVLKMCPPLTTKNYKEYEATVAVGCQNGSINLFNISDGTLWRAYSVHSYSVRGIEWVGLSSFISYSYSVPNASNLVHNELRLVDVKTGRITPFKRPQEEESLIKMVRVSNMKQYFMVVFKDKPFEVWDLKSGCLLREKTLPNITALCWSPTPSRSHHKKSVESSEMATSIMESTSGGDMKNSQAMAIKEHFVFTDMSGLLHHYCVEGTLIKEVSKIPPSDGMSLVTFIAWKGETLVLSDVDGYIALWDLRGRISKTFTTHRGAIKKMKFAPGRGNMKLLVFYDDGVDIRDVGDNTGTMDTTIVTMKSPRDIIKILDCDWAGSDKPIVLTADGCVRVVNLTFKNYMSPLTDYIQRDPVFGPHMLSPKVAFTLKYMLQHQPWNEKFSFQLDASRLEDLPIQRAVDNQLAILNNDIKAYLPDCMFGVAERCLLTAKLFGDESEFHFWTVALHYLRAEKADPMASRKGMFQESGSSGDLFIPGNRNSTGDLLGLQKTKEDWSFLKDHPLEMCYDVLCEGHDFQKYQLDRLYVHDNKRVTYQHTKKCAESLILLGQTDRAVQLLLETEADNDNYYEDSLKSCLVASIRSSGASQSTIKLVATNLIANGKLLEGAQLLCLIDKGLDACRYLQTYGEWHHAAWLAKATLPYADCVEVMRRWADHLCTGPVNEKSKAILVLLSLGQFGKVIEMLYGLQQFDRAARFIEACQEFDVLENNHENIILMEAIFLAYARHLYTLGNRQSAKYYCMRAGTKGQQMANEIDSM